MTAAITDFSQYTSLRKSAAENDPAALREVANQFEALFLQTMLKSMREASLGDPLFGNSDQHEMYQGMMDQQLAVELATGKGVGLADMLVRQLGGVTDESTAPKHGSITKSAAAVPQWADPQSFARDIWPYAEKTAKRLNVAPEVIVAQAALETGWGKHMMANNNGDASFNLFGIKSGGAWSGDRVSRNTLEFEAGVPRPQRASFRAYTDVESAFKDYADFLERNPRYERVRNRGTDVAGFAQALQDGGYATDPHYAEKIGSVLSSPTMARALAELKTGQ